MSIIGYINVSMETFGGLLSLIFICCLYITQLQKEKLEKLYIRMLVCNTVLLFCDAAAWLFKGRISNLSFFMVWISNFLVYSLGYLMLVLFNNYLFSFLKLKDSGTKKTPVYVMNGLMMAAFCLVVVSQFNNMYYRIDEHNIYHRQSWFWLSQTFGIAGMLINSWLLFRHRKKMSRKEILTFAIYICLPVAAMLFQILFYSIAVLYLATTICLLCTYMSIQVALSQETAKNKMELETAKTAVMLSQIQPHFLYNSLTGIKSLCSSEAERAEEAIEHFSFFLRNNLDSLSDTRLIPFYKEISHVKDYFYLEKMRFQDRVALILDLEVQDFMLPPLTIQPLVENAVRYGITKKSGGGTVTVTSRLQDGRILVEIRDDGIGFDVDAPNTDGRNHTGIENVRNRLKLQCGGSLRIISKYGEGTQVMITLPKKEELTCE